MRGTLKERMLPAPVNGGFRMDGYWIWCGSVIKGEDNRYHMFASRWPKEVPMHPGWMMKSEVVRAVADTPLGPFLFEEVVLPARGAQYWDGVATHNPHIMKVDDTYVLYYIGTTHPFPEEAAMETKVVVARANKRIGIATAKSVKGPWKRSDYPVLYTRPGFFDSFLVSNPAPCLLENHNVYMMYKARGYVKEPNCTWGDMTLGMARAKVTGEAFEALCSEPIFSKDMELEDPFMWHDEDGFNLMAKDMMGNISGEHFGGVHALSKDGIHWEVQKGKLFFSREILWDDGVKRRMGNLERPFLLFENGKPTHVYFATSDGDEETGFLGCKNTWNMVIPLR